jgi:hypothetical protein
MTDIEQKALIERLRQRSNSNYMLMSDPPKPAPDRDCHAAADLLEQLLPIAQEFDGFRQKVSDAVETALKNYPPTFLQEHLHQFIIPAPKPDPLVEIIGEINDGPYVETKAEYADRIRAALDARGLEIREKNDG